MLCTVLDAALITHWDFDSKVGCTITDQSGNGFTGTLVGCADITSSNCGFDGVGEALSICGLGSYLDAANPTCYNFNTSDWTWSGWIRTSDSCGAIFARTPNGTQWNQGSKALFVRCGTLQFDSGWVGNPQSGVCVDDNAWHHIVLTVDYVAGACADPLRMYIDGSLVNTTTNRDVTRYDETSHDGPWCNCRTANESLTFGQADICCPVLCSCCMRSLCNLDGLMDDGAIWNEILTDDEVKSQYDVGFACNNLLYDASDFDALKQIHDAGSGSVTLGSAGTCGRKIWQYATGLTGAAGLSGCGNTIVMNSGACTGLQAATTVYWDRHDGSAGASTGTTVNGTWNDCNANWNVNSDGSGSNVAWACNLDVHFSAGTDATGCSTITVAGTKQVTAMYFEEGNVTLCGGTITMSDGTPVIDVAGAATADINSVLDGTNGITKTGAGDLTLSANNTNTGTITITNGKVIVASDERIANAADITLNGGTLELANNVEETAADMVLAQSSSIEFGTQADLTMDNFTMLAGRVLTITGWDNYTRFSNSQADGTSFRIDNFPIGFDMNNVSVNGSFGAFKFINGGDGYYYLTLVAPEPSTYVAGFAMLVVLFLHYRRRCKKSGANRE